MPLLAISQPEWEASIADCMYLFSMNIQDVSFIADFFDCLYSIPETRPTTTAVNPGPHATDYSCDQNIIKLQAMMAVAIVLLSLLLIIIQIKYLRKKYQNSCSSAVPISISLFSNKMKSSRSDGREIHECTDHHSSGIMIASGESSK